MRYTTLLMLLLATTVAFAQQPAVNFPDLDYETALQQAKEAHKPLFLYIGQEGCGPCMKMEHSVFSQPAVVYHINSHFVPVAVPVNSETGKRFINQNNLTCHPLFVVIDGEGEIQHQFMGVRSLDAFMHQIKLSRDAENNLRYCKDQFGNGNRDPEFLRLYITRLQDAGELTGLEINAYFDTQGYRDLMKQENLVFLYEYSVYNLKPVLNIDSDAFRFLIRNRELFSQYYDIDQVEARIVMTAYNSALQAAEDRNSDIFQRSVEILRSFNRHHSYQLEDSDGNVAASMNGTNLAHTAEIKYYGKELVANR